MKRSLIISAIALGVWYLAKQLLRKEEKKTTLQPPKKHLTNAFAKAKGRAINVGA